jgi:uncharacterized protein (DUF2141 family)
MPTVKILMLSLLAGCLSLTPTATANPAKGDLTIAVTGLRNQSGQVCLKVFANSRGFPMTDEGTVIRECFKVTETPLTIRLPDLKLSSYAVTLFHDENSDRAFNRKGLGIPLEGFGFSRNPVVVSTAPTFGETAFLMIGKNTNIEIQMQYFPGS